MAKRHRISRSSSKKMFSKNSGTHKLNAPRRSPMRGGIRL